MEIREIAISHYGPLRDVRHIPHSGLQVFFGPNESGKTLLIDAILKLMLGNRLRDFAGIDRVPDPPRGRVSLYSGGNEHLLDGSTRLDQVTGLDSNHLRNVFVIRNKDLQLDGQANYLRRVSDQLTGMEGRRLTDLKDILRKSGRLTSPNSTARLSKSLDFGKIGEHVETAGELAGTIRAYLEESREKQVDSLERMLEESRRNIEGVSRQIQIQELAAKWHRHATQVQLVEEYETRAEVALRLQPYTKTAFMKLQDLTSRARAARETSSQSQRQLDQLVPRLEGAQAKLMEFQAQLGPLESRKPKLDHLEQQALLAASSPPPSAAGLHRFSYGLLGLAVVALGLAALGMLPPALLVTPAIALIGALALIWADRNERAKSQEQRRRDRSLLQEGAAAGVMAETLQQLAAAVAREKTGLEQAKNRQQILAATVRDMEQQQQHLEENLNAGMTLAENLEQQLSQGLQRLGIENLEQFGISMEEYNRAQARCDELHQRLEQIFGHSPIRAGGWREMLEQTPPPENPGLSYDRLLLAELREQKDALLAEQEQLQIELHRHQAEMNNIAAACQGLPLEQETGSRLPLRFGNLEMLEHAQTVLEQFVTTVRTQSEIASRAIEIMEELELEEREKMTDLVGQDRPVQEIFRSITGGRYSDVVLDSNLNVLVRNSQGLELPAAALSQGTYDQLYLALRLSLARDILGGKPGFLLLDDAFLCADSTRMELMLSAMAKLAAQGWHILYFTMDERLAKAAPRFTGNEIIQLSALVQ
jgi:hypothetical protein